jgi:hypothetical protein
LNYFLNFLFYHSMCQLGINSLLTTRCKHFPILGMLTNLGVKTIPFFHIKTPYSSTFWWLTCLQKELHLISSILFFPSTSNPTFENVQGFVFPYKQFCPCKFCNHFSWNFFCYIMFFFLMPTLGWMGLSSSTLGEDPLKDIGTSSMWFALEGL